MYYVVRGLWCDLLEWPCYVHLHSCSRDMVVPVSVSKGADCSLLSIADPPGDSIGVYGEVLQVAHAIDDRYVHEWVKIAGQHLALQ